MEFEVQGDLPEPAPTKNTSAVASAEKDESVPEEVTCSSSGTHDALDHYTCSQKLEKFCSFHIFPVRLLASEMLHGNSPLKFQTIKTIDFKIS